MTNNTILLSRDSYGRETVASDFSSEDTARLHGCFFTFHSADLQQQLKFQVGEVKEREDVNGVSAGAVIAALIFHFKHSHSGSRKNSIIITKLEEALMRYRYTGDPNEESK